MVQPIGMFDSGFGGLTVARAVIDLLPAEDRGGTRRNPEKPYKWQALERLAARLGVTSGMVHLTMREGATLDLIAKWRAALTPTP